MSSVTRPLLVLCVVCLALSPAAPVHAQTHSPVKIFIAPQGGFEIYLSAAFTKKQVPAVIVGDQSQADYVLESAPVEHKTESTGSKVARCLFLYCAGMEGTESASVRLVDARTHDTVWSYTVNKGHQREQSLAEAVAKHLKNEFLAKQGTSQTK